MKNVVYWFKDVFWGIFILIIIVSALFLTPTSSEHVFPFPQIHVSICLYLLFLILVNVPVLRWNLKEILMYIYLMTKDIKYV